MDSRSEIKYKKNTLFSRSSLAALSPYIFGAFRLIAEQILILCEFLHKAYSSDVLLSFHPPTLLSARLLLKAICRLRRNMLRMIGCCYTFRIEAGIPVGACYTE